MEDKGPGDGPGMDGADKLQLECCGKGLVVKAVDHEAVLDRGMPRARDSYVVYSPPAYLFEV